MCDEAYVGCPHCGQPADEQMRAVTFQTETVRYHLDVDGDVTYDHEPDYGEDHDTQNDGYCCLACGWSGHSLNDECVSESCECEECDPDAAEHEGDDPDQEVFLVLARPECALNLDPEDCPPELRFLAKDAARWFVPAPRWRGAELLDEHGHDIRVLLNPPFEATDEQRPFTYDDEDRKVVTSA
jgi:hypothetical protein